MHLKAYSLLFLSSALLSSSSPVPPSLLNERGAVAHPGAVAVASNPGHDSLGLKEREAEVAAWNKDGDYPRERLKKRDAEAAAWNKDGDYPREKLKEREAGLAAAWNQEASYREALDALKIRAPEAESLAGWNNDGDYPLPP